MNGDQITDLNLNKLLNFHVKNDPLVSIAAVHPRCPFGQVKIDKNCKVRGFMEKPTCLSAYINIGVYVFNHNILSYLPKTGNIENTTFPELAKSNKIKAYVYSGLFMTVNTTKELIEMRKMMMSRHVK